MVMLSEPIWLSIERKNSRRDSRKIVEIYGFKTEYDPDLERLSSRINDYVTYLCAASKWQQEGNSIDDNIFISNDTGNRYKESDPYIQHYMEKAWKERDLEWALIDTNKELDRTTPGMIDNDMIGGRKLWENLLEYGAVVDVTDDGSHK